MLLSTLTDAPANTEIETLGPVCATVVVGAYLLKDIFAAVRDVFGGRVRAYERTIADARMEAKDAVVAQAQALGADAILGLRYDHFPLRYGMFIVSVQGTAVRLKPTV